MVRHAQVSWIWSYKEKKVRKISIFWIWEFNKKEMCNFNLKIGLLKNPFNLMWLNLGFLKRSSFQYFLLESNIWDDWVMNSALLLADSPFSSLGVGRISMFKGCGMFLTTILRSRTTFVKALIVRLLAASFWALMRDWTCSRREYKCLSTSISPSSACANLAVLLVSISARA